VSCMQVPQGVHGANLPRTGVREAADAPDIVATETAAEPYCG
jgi:hypothetical protein